eukprot:scaffold1231_cov356-Pavlova_lutheri.AAC.3
MTPLLGRPVANYLSFSSKELSPRSVASNRIQVDAFLQFGNRVAACCAPGSVPQTEVTKWRAISFLVLPLRMPFCSRTGHVRNGGIVGTGNELSIGSVTQGHPTPIEVGRGIPLVRTDLALSPILSTGREVPPIKTGTEGTSFRNPGSPPLLIGKQTRAQSGRISPKWIERWNTQVTG